ncbi:MAG: hypothetical protein ACRD6X_17640 [Pyrinomonadaceae bacterium]
MSYSYIRVDWVSVVFLGMFALSSLCFAQVEGKQDTLQKKVKQRLHLEPTESEPPQGIRLLAGYRHKSSTDFEGNQIGVISKEDGAKINYELGFSQGLSVDSSHKDSYIWYREQKVGNRIIRLALKKNDILIISIPLDDDSTSLHAANFYCLAKKPEDFADVLLIVLPFALR